LREMPASAASVPAGPERAGDREPRRGNEGSDNGPVIEIAPVSVVSTITLPMDGPEFVPTGGEEQSKKRLPSQARTTVDLRGGSFQLRMHPAGPPEIDDCVASPSTGLLDN